MTSARHPHGHRIYLVSPARSEGAGKYPAAACAHPSTAQAAAGCHGAVDMARRWAEPLHTVHSPIASDDAAQPSFSCACSAVGHPEPRNEGGATTAQPALAQGTPHTGVMAPTGVVTHKGEEASPIKGRAADDEGHSVLGHWLASTLSCTGESDKGGETPNLHLPDRC